MAENGDKKVVKGIAVAMVVIVAGVMLKVLIDSIQGINYAIKQSKQPVRTDNFFEGLRYRSNGSGDFERRNQVDTAVVLWCLKNGNVFDVCAVNNVEPQKHIATFDEKTNQVLKGTQSGDKLVCKDGVPVENLRLKVLEQEAIKGK